jgi:hypothetical protein
MFEIFHFTSSTSTGNGFTFAGVLIAIFFGEKTTILASRIFAK